MRRRDALDLHVWLPWTWAVALAAVCLAWGIGAARSSGARMRASAPLARETALVLVLYAVWRIGGKLSLVHLDGAMRRGEDIWHIERLAGLPPETWIQGVASSWDGVVIAMDEYYRWVHAPALMIFLVWLFVRHRDHYPRWRTTLALTTAACLVIQFAPVAPPRMFPEFGFVDSALVHGQSVYGPTGGPGAWAAMPSVHVAWALVIGCAVWAASTSRWRWIGPGHAVATVLVVVATANHWWLDGIVAAVLMVGAWYLAPLLTTERLHLSGLLEPVTGDGSPRGDGHPVPRPTAEAADEAI